MNLALYDVATDVAERAVSSGASSLVYEGAIAALEDGRMVPGQRLVETELCQRFGVGRNAVREALQRLASEGIVVLSRHKGATIRELSPIEAIQMLELTELLVGLAARSAARAVDAVGAAASIVKASNRLSAAHAQEDDRLFIRARSAFFGVLLRVGGNRELQRMLPSVQVNVLRAQFGLTLLHRQSYGDYQLIGKAVLAGDAVRAERAARNHIRRVRIAIEAEYRSTKDPHA